MVTRRSRTELAAEYERKAKEIRDKEAAQKEIRELKARLEQLRGKKGKAQAGGKTARR